MRGTRLLALLVLAAAVHGQTPEMLEKARLVAINYTKSLPDFICTEVIHRYETYRTNMMPRETDVLTLQLGYFQMHESYKMVSRNGKPSDQSLESIGGAFSMGEFGSKLLLIFHPVSKTAFEFKKLGTIGSRRVAIYSYRIERENSKFELRTGVSGVVAGYHGDVYIDTETHLVLRTENVIDVPAGFPVEYSRDKSEYAYVKVAGRQILLPVRCESWAADALQRPMTNSRFTPEAYQVHYHNVIDFKNYRKYEAQSTLSFDPPKQ
ncbi:MAG TPA: hypothetical protein VG456_08730 [Candidatus Sulfopaludibacter sp.]|jgi:hypothetical protein|nr:hypothetical protein [Candidatus Sulfopaludibacter sp.]